MSTSLLPDLSSKIYPYDLDSSYQYSIIDHFDRLPDSILLIVFNKIDDIKALGRCCVVSRRFHGLVPQVDNVVVRVDCVISDDDTSTAVVTDKSRAAGVFANLIRFVFSGIVKPIQTLGKKEVSDGSWISSAFEEPYGPHAFIGFCCALNVLEEFVQSRYDLLVTRWKLSISHRYCAVYFLMEDIGFCFVTLDQHKLQVDAPIFTRPVTRVMQLTTE
ncbi:hypothetical protein IFM89_013243 [Coptis chinensis]|uniref:F-box domain-containing protein n=1 Tax=Coptis chinensis TaxID=261450 RepID=A0A835IRZ9_9MAGN|nr:hypothetical protein IFM89_013243 [Coptis chinensis]